MRFYVSSEVRALGIDAQAILIRNMRIANRNSALERLKKQLADVVRSRNLEEDPVLAGYREHYQRLGCSDYVPPAESLMRLIITNGRAPTINTAVDIYNLVAVETSLSLGAHDTARIVGDPRLCITVGTERYLPLNGTELVTLPAGEYACVDDEKVLCRLDVKQCEETKVIKTTREFLVYAQGNRFTTLADMQGALRRVGELARDIGGSEVCPLFENEQW